MPPNDRLPGHLKWHVAVAIELLAECPVDGIERRLFVLAFAGDVMQRGAFGPVSFSGNNMMILERDQV
jgi:hypothetical protein